MENTDYQNFNFDDLKIKGTNYWWASDIMKMLGYQDYDAIKKLLKKAIDACNSMGLSISDNFKEETIETIVNQTTTEDITDYKLTRFACYLIVMNADFRKPEVAKAQLFFYDEARLVQIYLQKVELDALVSKNQTEFNSIINLNKKITKEIIEKNPQIHFSTINIIHCKALRNIEIKNLKNINIFAGINNSGKTTLLEAIYLLTKLNDINEFFDTQRKRGKFYNELNTLWLDHEFVAEMQLNGLFNNTNYSIKISKEQEQNKNIDKSSYLSTITVQSEFDNLTLTSQARLYEKKDNETFFEKISVLCNSVYSSPFALLNKEDLVYYHEKSIELKLYPKIITFIRDFIDKDIRDIDLVGEGVLKRFLVTHDKFFEPIDLVQFGEGVQRIFYIALQFASAQNGVLLIDELENAIHFRLLVNFSKFIQELSERFNVQVFITSHSKDCIESFFQNGYPTENISCYSLIKNDNEILCKYISGEKFSKLIKSINADLRVAK